MPIKLDMANYEGQLPALAQAVVVVGELSVAGEGYELAVQEVRSGEQVLLSRKAGGEVSETTPESASV